MLRFYADFNSGGLPGHGACWLLRFGPDLRHVDEVADQLGLFPGMVVTLYYKEVLGDLREEFEVSAVLEKHNEGVRWRALPDWSTVKDLG